ncbi:MAG: hypothetical protein KF778_18015 [Rhodocyclaceae bacterium]|nr:hypothetical protein [Rhodocyclaceae bacterium]
MLASTWVGDALKWVVLLYVALAVGALVLCFVLPKSRRVQWVCGIAVAVAVLYFPVKIVVETKLRQMQRDARVDEAFRRYEEHCKTAGIKITRTVENVEGLVLMKVRPKNINYGDRYAMDDPYGLDSGGDGYIQDFLLGRDPAGYLNVKNIVRSGYRFVDVVDETDGKRYRYTGRAEEPAKKDPRYSKGYYRFVLEKSLAVPPYPRYGVTYDDISTREDRDYWIAGSSLKVIDLETSEVIAERVGYMVDPGQGNISGGRSPWLIALDYACPNFFKFGKASPGEHAIAVEQTRNFVEKVLFPKQ